MKMGHCGSKHKRVDTTKAVNKQHSAKRIVTHEKTSYIDSISSRRSSSLSSHPPRTNSARSLLDHQYQVLSQVTGYGVAGSVHPCIHRDTCEMYAVKCIKKSDVKRPDRIKREVEFLSEVNHPNIIRIKTVFEDDKHCNIVTEMCHGGELFDQIVAKAGPNGCFQEKEATRVIESLLSAVSYLHKHDIVHRDIKPENIMFYEQDYSELSTIKLIDFGLSIRHGARQKPLSNVVGTGEDIV